MTNRSLSRLYSILMASAAAIAVVLVISCAPKSANQDGAHGLGGPSQTPSPTLGGAGTTDSGGGTGLKDKEMAKMFEHFIKDPTKEPAYIKHIEPLFKNITDSRGDGSHFDAIFKMKNWYIAPVDFEKMSKESLGISFVKTSTVQIARQTARSVWIKKELYEQQGSKESGSLEQAETLLHEWVMSVYFFKFMPASDFCKFDFLGASEKQCLENAWLLDKASPSEIPRQLNDEDNENIRTITAWLFQNKDRTIPVQEFFQLLYRNGFDRRYFNPRQFESPKERLKELKLSSQEIFLAIEGTARGGQMPNLCRGVVSNQTRPCRVSIEAAQAAMKSGTQVVAAKGIRMRVDADGMPSADVTMVIGDEVTLSAADDGRDGIVYQLTVLEFPATVRVGDRLHHAVLWFRKENAGPHAALNLESVTWRVAEVVSIDKKRDPICLVRTPQVKTLSDDQLLIRSPSAKFNLSEDVYMNAPPLGFCSADIVVGN